MITQASKTFTILNTAGIGDVAPGRPIAESRGTLSTGVLKSPAAISTQNAPRPVASVVNNFITDSQYVLRQVSIDLANINNDSYTFSRCKMSITGSKYIGIQQDEFVIKLYNINFAAFAKSVNAGYKYITVKIEKEILFRGTIKTINTGRENIVEKVLELKCLMKVTELLSDMVNPITVNSSMNIWAVLSQVSGQSVTDGNCPPEVKNMKFENEKTFTGYRKTVIDDMISMFNERLNRVNNKSLPWIDYTLEQDGVINLFGPYEITEVLNMQPHTGLTDIPQISEDSVSFNSIYKRKLIPGRVVYMKNEYFTTIGGESAFVYAWDPNGFYVITEVRYSLDTYPNKYMCSCKARPLSKYNNFTASLKG